MAETETKGKVFGTPLFIWFILTETTPDLNSQKGPLLSLRGAERPTTTVGGSSSINLRLIYELLWLNANATRID
jgi:hypothetical protein|tara:strand:+ start:1005 stop:1226 length:222 start_codon:yes stop_codon:yes gene_type:complete